MNARRGRIVLMVLMVSATGRADSLLISMGPGDEPFLYFVNSYQKHKSVIQDLGLPRGGLDAGLDEESDTSAVVLQRPSSYVLTRMAERPTTLGIAVAAIEGSPLTVDVSLVIGSLYARTDRLNVFWNARLLGELDSRGAPVHEVQAQDIREFSLEVPGDLVAKTNVLWLRPVGRDPVVIDAIGLRSASALGTLPAEDAARGLQVHGPGPVAHATDRGRVLVCDMFSYGDGVWEYEVCRAEGAQVTVHRNWVDPSYWGDSQAVVLRTRHSPSAAQQKAMRQYVEAGGVLILTPGQVSYFSLAKPPVSYHDLEWVGLPGPSGHRFDEGLVHYRVEVPQGNPLGLEPRVRTFTRPGAAEHDSGFAPSRDIADRDVWVRMAHEPSGQGGMMVLVHSVGKGLVIGCASPQDVELLRLVRRILRAVLEHGPRAAPGLDAAEP